MYSINMSCISLFVILGEYKSYTTDQSSLKQRPIVVNETCMHQFSKMIALLVAR